MHTSNRALIFSYSDALFYFAGTTGEPMGSSSEVVFFKAEDGKPKKFSSLFQAKQFMLEMGFEKGWLVMYTAYDEMIGNERAQNAELPIEFTKDAE